MKQVLRIFGIFGSLVFTMPIILAVTPASAGCGFLDITCNPKNWDSPKKTIENNIIKPVLGRCGVPGEGTISVRFLLKRNQKIYVEVDKSGTLSGVVGQELNSQNTNFSTRICNQDGFKVRVYTPINCGKTLIAESRFSRVYNQETVWIKEDGIELQVGDFLNHFTEGGRTTLALIAAYYSGGSMTPVALQEASKYSPCLTGDRGCPLGPDLGQKIRSDRCLSSAVKQASAQIQPPPSQPNSYPQNNPYPQTNNPYPQNNPYPKSTDNTGDIVNAVGNLLGSIINAGNNQKPQPQVPNQTPFVANQPDFITSFLREYGLFQTACIQGKTFIMGLTQNPICVEPTVNLPTGNYFYNSSTRQFSRIP